MTGITYRVVVVTALLLIAGMAAGAQARLYDRLGGEAGVAAIADTLIERVTADPVLVRSFKDSNLDRIKKLLAEQICDVSGGPCHYSGDSMREVHAGHHISEAEFFGMVARLPTVLKERHVSQGAANELLRILAPMKREVVGLVVLGCNVHDNMVAFVAVVDSPYFAKTAVSGAASLSLPAGRYRLHAWHPNEAAAISSREITVSAAPLSIPMSIDLDGASGSIAAWTE